MNWKMMGYTDDVTGEEYSYPAVSFEGEAGSFWGIEVHHDEATGRYVAEFYQPSGHEVLDSRATLEEAKAAAEARARQRFLALFTSMARALGGRVVDVELPSGGLLAYDDELCPECNDGKSRIDWSQPSDPINDLYTCGLHEFGPGDLDLVEHHLRPGRVLLVHFPAEEEQP